MMFHAWHTSHVLTTGGIYHSFETFLYVTYV